MRRRATRTESNESDRKRLTITLDPEVHKIGVSMAKNDGRDFSHQVEALIKAEYQRTTGRAA